MATSDDDAGALTRATREVMDGRSSDRGDWPASVEVGEIEADIVDGELVILIRYSDTRYPDLDLGARFAVGSTFCTGTTVDSELAASHAAIYFGEATWAGGHPGSWDADDQGVRWHRDTLL